MIQATQNRQPSSEPSIGELLTRLTTDLTHVVEAEVERLKIQGESQLKRGLKATLSTVIFINLAIVTVQATVVALILGVGALLDNYAVAALIATGVLLIFSLIAYKSMRRAFESVGEEPQKRLTQSASSPPMFSSP